MEIYYKKDGDNRKVEVNNADVEEDINKNLFAADGVLVTKRSRSTERYYWKQMRISAVYDKKYIKTWSVYSRAGDFSGSEFVLCYTKWKEDLTRPAVVELNKKTGIKEISPSIEIHIKYFEKCKIADVICMGKKIERLLLDGCKLEQSSKPKGIKQTKVEIEWGNRATCYSFDESVQNIELEYIINRFCKLINCALAMKTKKVFKIREVYGDVLKRKHMDFIVNCAKQISTIKELSE